MSIDLKNYKYDTIRDLNTDIVILKLRVAALERPFCAKDIKKFLGLFIVLAILFSGMVVLLAILLKTL